MTKLYREEELVEVEKTKKKMLIIYFIILGVILVLGVIFAILYINLPYAYNGKVKGKGNLYYAIICGVFILFSIFSFVYLGIPYKRVKAYRNFLKDVFSAKIEVNNVTFMKNDLTVTEKGNIDFHTMLCLEWSDKTQEYMQRNVLVDKDKEMPNFNKGDIIKIKTYSNVLVEYGNKEEYDIFNKEI